MTSASAHPKEGAKILLERERVSEDGARADYRAHVYTPERRYDLDAALSTDGEATLAPREGALEPELLRALENIAKSIARAADRKRQEDLPPWPRRISRWRRGSRS